jgi:hypothetical protein
MQSDSNNDKRSAKTLKSDLEAELLSRFGDAVRRRESTDGNPMTTGLAEVDALTGGLPRGAITEILGTASSGRTTLAFSILAAATARDEVCALVDATDSLDAPSAATAGVDLQQLLWVRCGGNVGWALKAADLLLQSGGFGLVILDLGDIPTDQARRIQASWWHRFRRAVEKTPTVVVVIEREPNSRSASSLALEMKREEDSWTRAVRVAEQSDEYSIHATLVRGYVVRVERVKPAGRGVQSVRIEPRSSYIHET